MKVHEYQASSLFNDYGIPTVPSEVADSPMEAVSIARKLGGRVVIKAQVLVGGRGKAGGVKIARAPDEAGRIAGEILSMEIKSIPVKKVLVARALDIRKEYYAGITVDRAAKKIAFMISAAGGVEIERLAEDEPEKIYKLEIEPAVGVPAKELAVITEKLFQDPILAKEAAGTMAKLYRLFIEKDCSLAEINPYVLDGAGKLMAADAKINFDDNALFKHPEIRKMRNAEEYSADETSASDAGLSFVGMDGDIGCIVNGAGLAMATMDVIKLFGGEPANFLDVGGSSNPEKVLNALKIITGNKKVKAILVNIFGGITRCDDIANGIIMAGKKLGVKVPMVIRLIGTNDKEGRAILEREGFTVAEEMTEAVKQAVGVARGQ